MSAFKNEITVQYGSQVLSIGAIATGPPVSITAGVSYVADNITINRTSKTILRTNEIDEPTGQVSYKGEPDTGTAQLQLAADATAVPTQGHGFIADLGFGNEVYYLTDISQPLAKDGETKVNVTFRESIALTPP